MGDAHVDRAVPPGIGTRSSAQHDAAEPGVAGHLEPDGPGRRMPPQKRPSRRDLPGGHPEGERIAQSRGERENPDAHGRRLESPACWVKS